MERRYVYGGGIALAGTVLVIVQLVQGFQQSGRPVVFAFQSAPFILVALALAFTGLWLSRQERYEPDLPGILAWGVGSTVLFASVGALQLFSQQVTLGTLEGAEFTAINFVTVGAVVGVLVGLYDARSRDRKRDLEAQKARIEAFGNKAADINNYGRELNRCSSLAQISGLCIQGMQALLGLHEVAFVLTDKGDAEIVNNTVVNVSDETLLRIARGAVSNEKATVVEEGEVDGLGPRAGDALSILVTGAADSSVVLVAFTDESTAFEEEDIQLLELMVAHAGTAIERLETDSEQPPVEGTG